MANMLNIVVIEGYLGADAEVRTTENGRSLTKMRVANTRKWKTKAGEQKEETTWVNITSWNENLKGIVDYLTKGRQVKVVGRLNSNTYQDKDGANRVSYEVLAEDVMLGSSAEDRKAAMDSSPAPSQNLKTRVQAKRAAPVEDDGEDDSELPW